MGDAKFVPDSKGFIELLNSQGVQDVLRDRATAIAKTAESIGGGKYSVDVRAGEYRAHARASTADRRAYWSNCKGEKRPLVSAMDAGV